MTNQMRSFVCFMTFVLVLTVPADNIQAEIVECPGAEIWTENAGEDSALICNFGSKAIKQLGTCNLKVPTPISIRVADELGEQCLGIYHCGKGLIEILAPRAYVPLRAKGEASAFADVSDDAFIESVIRHELAHAAMDTMPCPFASCTASQEYVAYSMQVRFLPEADRLAFESSITHEGPVSRDMLSSIMLAMAPDIFARRAWLHLSAKDDPCAFIGQIANGDVLLDFEHP